MESVTRTPGDERCERRAVTRELLVWKALLGLLVLGIALAGKGVGSWPLVTWPMYSTTSAQAPAVALQTVVRAVDERGRGRELTPIDLAPYSHVELVDALLAEAFEPASSPRREQAREWLVNVVRRRPSDARIIALEAWRHEWPVRPRALPPFARDDVRRALVGRFEISDGERASRRGP